MEVLVQLPIAVFVSVDGLDGHVKKVWTDFTLYVTLADLYVLLNTPTLECVH